MIKLDALLEWCVGSGLLAEMPERISQRKLCPGQSFGIPRAFFALNQLPDLFDQRLKLVGDVTPGLIRQFGQAGLAEEA